LLLLIGLILFHVLVLSGSDIPPNVEKLLTLLATALTSIIAFYFGAKAAEVAQQTAASASAQATHSVPKPPGTFTPVPSHGKSNDEIALKGAGFGTQKGNVTFGTTPAEVTSWSDTEVKIKIPSGIVGRSKITVTPVGSGPIDSAPDVFAFDG